MVEVVGVRFRTAGKIYFFDPKEFQVRSGDHVIVETARGIEFGSVVSERRQVKEKCIGDELKPVLRIATKEDEERAEKNREKEKEAYQICLEKIKEHNLDMKLVSTEYTFDNNKVLFYFTADGRVDFRELVKDLAAVFRTRIELRQIGVRDEAKMLGGMGICGRKLCCNTFLSEFAPVSIKMAKEQNLSLNPTKISGVCGRLMCCLKNEQETYEYLNSKLPNIGEKLKTKDGVFGEVQRVDVLRQKVKLIVEDENGDKEIQEYKIDDLGINGYQIIQKEQGFCFGMDAVLLSDFAQVKNGGRVLDLGTGTGILPILMEAKSNAAHLTGLEIQSEMAEMAARSVKLNHLEDKIEIVEGDIKEASAIFSHDSFDTITSNPPYMIGQHGLKNPSETKAIARHEILCTFADITVAAKKLLKNKGKLFLVHRTFRLSEILCQLSKDGLEPKRIRFVHPYIDKEPNIFLLEAVKGGKSRMTVEPPLIVYEKEGKYTEEIYKIYGMNPEE